MMNSVLARTGLMMAAACAVLHLVIVVQRPDVGSSVMLAIAVACSACMWHGRKAPHADMWAWMCLGTLSMLVLHISLHTGGAHHGPDAGLSVPNVSPSLSWASDLALVLVCVELAVCASAVVIAGVRLRRSWHATMQRKSV